jgi:hypothetical protein
MVLRLMLRQGCRACVVLEQFCELFVFWWARSDIGAYESSTSRSDLYSLCERDLFLCGFFILIVGESERPDFPTYY